MKINEVFEYNLKSDITTVHLTIDGFYEERVVYLKGYYRTIEEVPNDKLDMINKAKAFLKTSAENTFKKDFEAYKSLAEVSQLDQLNVGSSLLCQEYRNLGNSIVELNIENAILLKYIKELYGEFIENDLSTEETLNAKQLTIKEWLEK